MRVTRIAWANYRRIPDETLLVGDRLMLVGPNDSGKSSVLRALDLCLGVSRSQLSTAITLRDLTDVAHPLRLEVTLTDLSAEERAAFPDEIDVTGGLDAVTIVVEAVVDAPTASKASVADLSESLTVRRFFTDAGHTRGPRDFAFSHVEMR